MPKPAPTTFTDPIRQAQKERMTIEMNNFFTYLAKEEFEWPAVPDDLVLESLADALVMFSNVRTGAKTLHSIIELLQQRLAQLPKD